MNPEKPSREEIEAKLTALLLGELPAEEAQLLRWAISQDAELAKSHDRLKLTVGFVREVAAHPADATPAQTAQLKLSEDRREKLLAHFKTVRPVIFLPPLKKRRDISPFLAMAAAVALIALLAAMLLPALSKAKNRSARVMAMNEAREVAVQNQEDQNSTSSVRAKAAADNLDMALPKTSLASQTGLPAGGVVTVVNATNAVSAFENPQQQVARLGWQNSTPIVLPAASPAPSGSPAFGSVGTTSDQDVYTVHLNNADPNSVLQGLQNKFPSGDNSAQVLSRPSVLQNREQQMEQNSSLPQNNAQVSAENNFGLDTSSYGKTETLGEPEATTSGRQVQMRDKKLINVVTGFEFNNGTEGGGGGGNNSPSNATGTDRLATRPQQMNSSSSSSTALGTANGNTGGNPFWARFGGRGGSGGGGGGGGFGGGGRGGGRGGDVLMARSPAATPPAPAVAPSVSETPAFQLAAGNISTGGFIYQADESENRATPSDGPSYYSKKPMLVDKTVFDNLLASHSANYSGAANAGTAGGTALPAAAPLVAQTTATGNNFGLPPSLGVANGRNSPSGFYDSNYSDGANRSGQIVDSSTSYALANDSFESRTGTFGFQGNNSYNGVTKDNASGLRYLYATNNIQIENNGTIRVAQISPDTDTHNLISTANPVKMGQIQGVIKNLPPAPATAAARSYARVGEGSEQENSLPAPAALAPIYAPSPVAMMPPPPVVGEQKAKLGIDLQGGSGFTVNLAYAGTNEDRVVSKPSLLAPVPTPEFLTGDNAFSTFSLNVSDVSFKLAAASLQKNVMPDAASIRSEEFINAFDYRDPEPLPGVPVAFVSERARDPFAHNRDLLRFSIKTAAAGREAGRPLNIVLLLDDSGSMERADRVAIIHEALKVLASQLQPQDTLSIVTFARTARLWVDGARGDQAGTAVNEVSNLTPEGGTNLEDALNLAYATARRHYLAKGVNRVVLLTDGAANLGNVDPDALKQKVESFRKQGIALDCFGIGWEGYNDDLLEVLSSNGDGRYGFINTPEAATTEFAAQLAGALHVAAEDVKVQVEFNPQRVISWRQIGYAKHQLTKEQFRDNTVAAAPMAAREAGNALYTVEINPQGSGPVATVRVRFRIPGTTDVSEHEWQVSFDGTAPALENSSPAMRLAATAGEFSEWLASSPFAQEVTTGQLLNDLSGVPQIYGADPRPKQLETMIREANSIAGQPSQPNRSGSGGFGSPGGF